MSHTIKYKKQATYFHYYMQPFLFFMVICCFYLQPSIDLLFNRTMFTVRLVKSHYIDELGEFMKNYFIALSLVVIAFQAQAQSQGILDRIGKKSFGCIRKDSAIVDGVALNYVSLKVDRNDKGSILTVEGVSSLTNILVNEETYSACEMKDINGKLFKTGRLIETLSFEMSPGAWFNISQIKKLDVCDKGDLEIDNNSKVESASLNLNYGETHLSDFLCNEL